MTDMQVFAGLWAQAGVSGDVLLSNITVTGSPVPIPAAALKTPSLGMIILEYHSSSLVQAQKWPACEAH